MQWLKAFFGGKPAPGAAYVSRQVTHKHPLVIQNPKIGFLNLIGTQALPLVDEDITALKPLFSGCLESAGDLPVCDVLMIYATIRPDGLIQNASQSLRELIYKSHAPIVVVATENSAQSYIAAGKRPGAGKANLVMTMKRNGLIFPNFFKELFGMMYRGVSMPMAWVKLAPQIPGKEHDNVPGTICAMEVTHVIFKSVVDSAR
jgi:hypothetical protein